MIQQEKRDIFYIQKKKRNIGSYISIPTIVRVVPECRKRNVVCGRFCEVFIIEFPWIVHSQQ